MVSVEQARPGLGGVVEQVEQVEQVRRECQMLSGEPEFTPSSERLRVERALSKHPGRHQPRPLRPLRPLGPQRNLSPTNE
jgi:hypothetical protein